MSTRIQQSFGLAAITVLLAFATGGGCVITVDPNPNNNGSGTGNDGKLTIRIINATNVTLDPQLFLSAEAVTTDGLFQDANKYTSFGVGTLGLIADSDSVQFEIDCDTARVLGTLGGSFGNDLNAPDGQGRQLVLTQDLNVFCGDRVTFTFLRSGGGFSTNFDID